MITHSMKARRQLRSARVTALTVEERRSEMRVAEARFSGASARPDRRHEHPELIAGITAEQHEPLMQKIAAAAQETASL